MCNRRKFSNRSIVVFLVCVAGFVALCAPVYGSDEWTGLEERGFIALGESQMADMRGGYLGFYFSITFSGFWDTQGNQWADIDYDAGFNGSGQSGQITLSSADAGTSSGDTAGSGDGTSDGGTQFTAKAILGGFNGGQGLFQVNQVPGSDNIVSNSLILNLTVYNVSESQAPAVMQSLKLLAPAF
jgi:hypothetical protein